VRFVHVPQPCLQQLRERDESRQERWVVPRRDGHARDVVLRHPVGDLTQRLVGERNDRAGEQDGLQSPVTAAECVVEDVAAGENPEQAATFVGDRVQALTVLRTCRRPVTKVALTSASVAVPAKVTMSVHITSRTNSTSSGSTSYSRDKW
jgi:hypothetical protein